MSPRAMRAAAYQIMDERIGSNQDGLDR